MFQYMKLLMKKVGGTTESEPPKESEQTPEEQVPKKVRNRPLFHVKVILLYYSLFIHWENGRKGLALQQIRLIFLMMNFKKKKLSI